MHEVKKMKIVKKGNKYTLQDEGIFHFNNSGHPYIRQRGSFKTIKEAKEYAELLTKEYIVKKEETSLLN